MSLGRKEGEIVTWQFKKAKIHSVDFFLYVIFQILFKKYLEQKNSIWIL